MLEIKRTGIARKVLAMLTGDSSPSQIQPKWEKQSLEYLHQCLHLYKGEGTEEKRCKHLGKFVRVLPLIDLDPKIVLNATEETESVKTSTAEAIKNGYLDCDAIVIAFQILAFVESEYSSKIRDYLCKKLKEFFSNHKNHGPASRTERLCCFARQLEEPINLTMANIRSLIEFVKSQPGEGRDRIEDIKHVAILWQKTPEFEKSEEGLEMTLVALANRGQQNQVNCVNLAFDIIELFARNDDYRNTCINRLAGVCADECKNLSSIAILNSIDYYLDLTKRIIGATGGSTEQWLSRFREYVVSELKIRFRETKTVDDRQQLVEVVLALFRENTEKCTCFRVLQKIGMISNLDGTKWRETIFAICEADAPIDKTKKYLYVLLSHLIDVEEPANAPKPAKENISHKMPNDISIVIAECKGRFSDQEYIEIVLNKLIRGVDTNNSMSKYHYHYIDRVLWLSELFKESDKGRKAAEEMSKYRVIKGFDKDQDYYRIHARLVLRLLCSSNYPKVELEKLKKEIEELHNNDTLNCPAKTPQMREKTEWNFKVCRDVINILFM